MRSFLPIDTAPQTPAREDTPLPERLLEGAPVFRTWPLDTAKANGEGWTSIHSGIWEATPGTTVSIKGESYEFCHILEGRCEISEDGGETRVFGPGDSFLLKPGFIGRWKTLETLRKIYVIAE